MEVSPGQGGQAHQACRAHGQVGGRLEEGGDSPRSFHFGFFGFWSVCLCERNRSHVRIWSKRVTGGNSCLKTNSLSCRWETGAARGD